MSAPQWLAPKEAELAAAMLTREVGYALANVTVYTPDARRMEALHEDVHSPAGIGQEGHYDVGGMAWGYVVGLEYHDERCRCSDDLAALDRALDLARPTVGDAWCREYRHLVVDVVGPQYLQIGWLRRQMAKTMVTLWADTIAAAAPGAAISA